MNIFRLVGDMSHLSAIILLLIKMWKTRSCAGIRDNICIFHNIIMRINYIPCCILVDYKTPNINGRPTFIVMVLFLSKYIGFSYTCMQSELCLVNVVIEMFPLVLNS